MYDCSRSAITLNNLNLPSYDVHSREARDQMLVNLYELQESFVKINDQLNGKLKSQNERVEKLKKRINLCNQKIGSIQGVSKAITFYSPGQYPKKYKFDPQRNISIFKEFLERTRVTKFDLNAHYQMKHDVQNLGKESKLQINELYNFVSFLYTKLKCKRTGPLEKGIVVNKKEMQSLGRIPTTISYVDSLTVFNTNINPYKKYQIVDNSLKNTVKKKQLPKNNLQKTDDNLKTIEEFKSNEFDVQNRNYKPLQKQIDDIDFDDTIGLEGVVQLPDPSTFETSGPSIVKKTIAKDPMSGKKEQVPQNNKPVQQSQPTSNTTTQNNSLPPPPVLKTTQSSVLPPPPPPPVLTSTQSSLPPPPPPPVLTNNIPPPPPPPVLTNTQGSIPPPPPPPPILNNPPSLPAQAPVLQSQVPPPASGSRSALLSQLNTANPMARLKKTITKEVTGTSKNNPPPPPAGDGSNPPLAEQERPRAMSMMQALQLKIKNRFIALHPERQEVGEESEEDN